MTKRPKTRKGKSNLIANLQEFIDSRREKPGEAKFTTISLRELIRLCNLSGRNLNPNNLYQRYHFQLGGRWYYLLYADDYGVRAISQQDFKARKNRGEKHTTPLHLSTPVRVNTRLLPANWDALLSERERRK